MIHTPSLRFLPLSSQRLRGLQQHTAAAALRAITLLLCARPTSESRVPVDAGGAARGESTSPSQEERDKAHSPPPALGGTSAAALTALKALMEREHEEESRRARATESPHLRPLIESGVIDAVAAVALNLRALQKLMQQQVCSDSRAGM